MRIPTVLGLSIVTVGLVIGVIKTLSLTEVLPASQNQVPIDIKVTNISATQASITWDTSQPTAAELLWGESTPPRSSKSDDRDPLGRKRLTHFFTLKNLRPNTTYYYLAQDDGTAYPDLPLHFTTAATKSSVSVATPPITGVVVDSSLHPVDEAIVTLESPSISPISAFTITAGNFLIPTSQALNNHLNQTPSSDNPIKVKLTVRRGTAVSIIKLSLPRQDSTLPNIVLGGNLDLTVLDESSPSASP